MNGLEIKKDGISITQLLIDDYCKNCRKNPNDTLTYKPRHSQSQYYLLTAVRHNGQKLWKQIYTESFKVLQTNLTVLKRSEKIYRDYSPEYIQRNLPDSYRIHSSAVMQNQSASNCRNQLKYNKIPFG